MNRAIGSTVSNRFWRAPPTRDRSDQALILFPRPFIGAIRVAV